MAGYFDTAGKTAGNKFTTGVERSLARSSPRIQRSLHGVKDAADAVTRAERDLVRELVRSGKETERSAALSDRLAAAHRRHADANRSAASAIRQFTEETAKAAREGRNLTRIVQDVGTAAFKTSRGVATFAAPAALKFLVDFAQVAVTATQSLYLLPAAATAAAAGIGTLDLATSGFMETVKNVRDPEKFAEEIQKIAPAAQQAALAVREVLPEFDKLKAATESAFFEGFAQQIQRLSTEYLPSIQGLTVSIATSFNNMIDSVADQLMTPDTRAAMRETFSNISATFQNLVPAAQSLTQAFTDITAVGSSFLPGLATDISNTAREFANFIREARNSGQLAQWIQEGIDAVKILGQAVFDLGQLIFRIFGQDGKANVENFQDTLKGTREIIGFLTLDFKSMGDSWREELNSMGEANDNMIGDLGGIRDAIMDIPEAIATMVNKFVDGMNWMGKNAHNFLDMFPGEIAPFEPLPHLNWGDWGGHDMPPPPNTGPYSDRGYTGTTGSPTGQQRWTNPTTGAVMVLVPGVGWVPEAEAGPQAGAPWNDQAVPGIPGSAKGVPNFAPELWQNISMEEFNRQHGIAPGLAAGPSAIGIPPGAGPGSFQVDPQKVADAEATLARERSNLLSDRLRLLELEASGDATQREILDAKATLTEDETALNKAQRELVDAQQGTYKEMENQVKSFSETMLGLDSDLGFSKGLSGLAENLVKFLGSLAAAPILGPLNAISAAQGGKDKTGSGLIGMLAAQGGGGSVGGGGASILDAAASGGAGLLPSGSAAMPGESARSFAHRAMVPFWENLGFTVGDHAADQFGEHQNGALDIMVDSLEEGQTVLQQVLSDPNTYGAIFNNQTFGYGQGAGPRNYSAGHTGNPTQDHQDHVHAWYKPGGQNNIAPPGGSAPGGGLNWDALAAQEASGNWANTSNPKYSGGLQFDAATWAQYGGTQYAPTAAQASKDQQIAIAQRAYNARGDQGASLWPQNYQQLQLPGMASGGEVPIIAHRGEHMLTGGDVKAMGGHRGVYTFRNALHMQGGGPIGVPFPHQPPPPIPSPSGPFGPRAEKPPPPPPGPVPVPGVGTGPLPGPAPTGAAPPSRVPELSPIGGVEKDAPPGGGESGGGLVGLATSAAAMAADTFAPGSGAAVQIASQEIQRAIKFGSQVAAIGAGGLMETFLPFGASDLANNNWITRIAGGFAGVQAQIPNLAGKSASTDAMAQQGTPVPMRLPPPISSGQGSGPAPGPPIVNNITYNNNGAANAPGMKEMSDHLTRQYTNVALGGR